jgi:MFS family permease
MAESEFNRRSITAAIGAGVGFILSVSAFVNPIFGVFMVPLTHEFGWGRGEISATHTFYSWTMAACFLVTGRLMDRFGVRAVLLPGIALLSCTIASLSLQNGSIALLYGQYMMVGVCGALGGLLAYSKVISGWFHHHRGILLSVMSVGGIVGAGFVPRLANSLIDEFGWRGAYVALGALMLVIGLPVVGLLVREAPVVVAARSAAGRASREQQKLGMSGAEARRTLAFALCVASAALVIVTNSAMIAHTVPLLTDRGLSRGDAVTVMMLIGIGGGCGHLTCGYLLDRVNTPRIAMPFAVLALIGVLLLQYGSGFSLYLVAGACLGAGITADSAVIAYFLTRFFGIRAFGEVYGMLWAIAAIVSGLGPPLMGWVYDKTGSYQWGLTAVEGALLLIMLCYFLMPAYRYPARLHAFQADDDEEQAVAGGRMQPAGNAD